MAKTPTKTINFRVGWTVLEDRTDGFLIGCYRWDSKGRRERVLLRFDDYHLDEIHQHLWSVTHRRESDAAGMRHDLLSEPEKKP